MNPGPLDPHSFGILELDPFVQIANPGSGSTLHIVDKAGSKNNEKVCHFKKKFCVIGCKKEKRKK